MQIKCAKFLTLWYLTIPLTWQNKKKMFILIISQPCGLYCSVVGGLQKREVQFLQFEDCWFYLILILLWLCGKLIELIDTFSKAWMLELYGLMWWRNSEETTDLGQAAFNLPHPDTGYWTQTAVAGMKRFTPALYRPCAVQVQALPTAKFGLFWLVYPVSG